MLTHKMGVSGSLHFVYNQHTLLRKWIADVEK